MPVTLGSTPDAGFDEPLRLLTDCHVRIRHFLRVLCDLAAGAEGVLPPDHRRALEISLRYFAEAAPKHTEDEEESLFPRLRESSDAATRSALGEMDRLHADHEHVAPMHEEVDRLGRIWLSAGCLARADAERLRSVLGELSVVYARHIEAEEETVFKAAARALDQSTLEKIGREMAQRRGVSMSGDEPAAR